MLQNNAQNKPYNKKKSLRDFLQNEAFSAILLLFSAALAFYFANSSFGPTYHQILHKSIFHLSILHWINDGLMVLFFFVVGLEIKREILIGELSTKSKAALPIIAALGGAISPALIYAFINHHDASALKGWGIPMATDIAFAVGVLSLFSRRVHPALKIFLLALAIADDLFAVLIIAFFYTEKIAFNHLLFASFCIFAVLIMQKLKIKNYFFYVAVGIATWFFVLQSGVHATIAGVVLGLLTPLKIAKSDQQPIKELIHWLHPWVSFLIMPVFALANAGVTLGDVSILEMITHPVAYGVFFGLFFGKPLGVMAFLYVAQKLNLAKFPKSISRIKILGVAHLTGIGFTMAIFVCGLALSPELQNEAKVGILLASLLSAVVGALYLFIK